jgi:4-azaleucine resistance transporter AzlC
VPSTENRVERHSVARYRVDPEFRDGFIAMLPLWLGIISFAIAFALLATTTGLTSLETIALSALVFAGSAQLAFVDLVGSGAGAVAILLTVLLLNLRHILYGLPIDAKLPHPRQIPIPILAAFITDESFGLAVRRLNAGEATGRFLFGASLGLYLPYVTVTAIGSLIGNRLPDPERLHLDVVLPLSFLSFLALLIPFLRNRRSVLVATIGAALSLSLREVVNGGAATLLAICIAAALGAWLQARGPAANA